MSEVPLNRRGIGWSREKRGQLKRVSGLSPESQGQNLAVAVLYVPDSHDSVGHGATCVRTYRGTSLIRKRPTPRDPLGP
jgi:hypothetical protein